MSAPGSVLVTLTVAPTDLASGWADAVLDRAELVRAARLAPAARDRFPAGRALLALVVARQLAVPPHTVVPRRRCEHCGEEGHGRVLLPGAPLGVALSRARDTVVVATVPMPPSIPTPRSTPTPTPPAGSPPIRLGVDVEDLPPRSPLPDPELVLSPRELSRHGPLGSSELLRCWTRKEAVLKATGRGLSVPMTALELTGPDRPPALLAWRSGAAGGEVPADPVALADLGPLRPPVLAGSAGGRLLGAVAVVGATAVEVHWAEPVG